MLVESVDFTVVEWAASGDIVVPAVTLVGVTSGDSVAGEDSVVIVIAGAFDGSIVLATVGLPAEVVAGLDALVVEIGTVVIVGEIVFVGLGSPIVAVVGEIVLVGLGSPIVAVVGEIVLVRLVFAGDAVIGEIDLVELVSLVVAGVGEIV